ncbi:hypothetical protein [Vibrio barjaei]|uniref:hypothetical protein n=1 Tax=Vibrio barjaei TaxID=1676683 RepID=UPI00228400EF|nr:hypothetical protein [Vibrio barjaei]MCY9874917.1 hypothetical protein [Vibrio barjaei]
MSNQVFTTSTAQQTESTKEATLKGLINTPLKKAAFSIFVLGNISLFAAPAGITAYGSAVGWSAGQIASYSGFSFIVNEVFIMGSALMLGKPIVVLVKSKIKKLFGKK